MAAQECRALVTVYEENDDPTADPRARKYKAPRREGKHMGRAASPDHVYVPYPEKVTSTR